MEENNILTPRKIIFYEISKSGIKYLRVQQITNNIMEALSRAGYEIKLKEDK